MIVAGIISLLALRLAASDDDQMPTIILALGILVIALLTISGGVLMTMGLFRGKP